MEELKIVSPAPHLCQICAVAHPPEWPHNAQSLYYQWTFAAVNKRSVTWADAMEHCTDEIKYYWIEYLTRLGVDLKSPNLTGDLKTEHDLVDRTANLVAELRNKTQN